jgi:acyl carrier protein
VGSRERLREAITLSESSQVYQKTAILHDLIQIIDGLIGDWEVGFSGKLGPDTLLVSDLGLESIDVVGFIVAIEEHYQRQDLPFGKLVMVDDRYVEDMSLGELADFLHRHLNK